MCWLSVQNFFTWITLEVEEMSLFTIPKKGVMYFFAYCRGSSFFQAVLVIVNTQLNGRVCVKKRKYCTTSQVFAKVIKQ